MNQIQLRKVVGVPLNSHFFQELVKELNFKNPGAIESIANAVKSLKGKKSIKEFLTNYYLWISFDFTKNPNEVHSFEVMHKYAKSKVVEDIYTFGINIIGKSNRYKKAVDCWLLAIAEWELEKVKIIRK